jgi:uncharacterized protein (TIGR04255 family)
MSPLLDPGRPPLIEVAMTAQFEEIKGLTSAHVGALWSRSFRSSLPNVEEHVPIESVLEVESPALQQGPIFSLRERPAAPRFFFVNADGSELVQLQTSRISYNWRRRGTAYNYLRYESLKSKLSNAMTQLQSFLDAEKLGPIKINLCEILYVNHVLYHPGPDAHRHIGRLVKALAPDYDSLAGAPLEDATVNLRHRLRAPDGRFLGRLLVGVAPAYLVADQTPLYKVQLTARGQPIGEGEEGAHTFFDLAHQTLRAAFSELFSETIQEDWMAAHGH